jgi:hypothetical protein
MPGLIRGVARTAVVAGTATAVSNRVSRRQGERWQRQYEADAYEQQQYQQQYEPPPQQYQQPVYAAPAPAPAPAATDHVAALQQLAELKTQGILTDAEFAAEKARILAS